MSAGSTKEGVSTASVDIHIGNDKKTKYKPPKQKSIFDGLQFAPLAQNIVTADCYILFTCGLVNFITELANPIVNVIRPERNPYPGVYCVILSILITLWHSVGSFNREDKSVEAFLNPRTWPVFIRLPITYLMNYLAQSIACLFLSVYCFFSVLTALGGAVMIMAGFVYMIAFLRQEKPKPITGLR